MDSCPTFFVLLANTIHIGGLMQNKQICKYVLPAVGGLCVTYLYNIIDGIFVGQGVGATALGSVNIAVPFITFAVAIATMLPMGGATIVAIRTGREDYEGANHAFITAFILTALFSVILTAVGLLFPREVVLLSGGYGLSENMIQSAQDYIFYYMLFAAPMLMSNCLSVFVRNDGSPTLSFVGMCGGALTNVLLDWLFIYPLQWGIIGAAIASGLGQIVSLLILSLHFLQKKGNLRIKFHPISGKLIGKIFMRGLPEGISQMNTPITALCFNIVLARMVGDIGVSTFSVLGFIFSLSNAILSGAVQGLQPLWGVSYGMRDNKGLRYCKLWGLKVNVLVSILLYVILCIFTQQSIRIFNQDADLIASASAALPAFALSFIPMAVNLVYTGYFFSTKCTKQANIIAISRGILTKAVCIFGVPILFGVDWIWYAPFATELITLGMTLVIILFEKKRNGLQLLC